MDPSRRIIPTPDCPDCYVLCSYLPCFPPFPLPPPPPPLPPSQSTADTTTLHIDHRHLHLAASVLLAAALFLLLLSFSVVLLLLLLRRRRRRASSAASGGAASATAEGEWDGDGDGDGDGEVHHVWYIRTVGLDEATIASIAVAEYKSETGLLGAADCSVCLGEFRDGELVRLLPKCAHAFHVACIDTWLRSHVSCPLCRARIVDPAPAGVLEIGVGARDVFDELPVGVLPAGDSESSTVDSDLGESGLQPVRRSVSMDSPFISMNVAGMVDEQGADESGKEPIDQEEQSSKDKEKQANPSKTASTQRSYPEIGRSSSSSSRGFFFSRHGRARSSILPM
ncbi:E3 ubiquitin-protein ligase Os04g0590900-like [Ananas comosus]|uniref:RING-type E3 ubiquitin transferase n=1 Tax=Ananas comosus TaxID=4615 RepID=A0A6P5ENC3_ANACO|nr:E3 ubiquitin-protein ligase Os04g0590900-like [Ananas comosus]